ncbi:MAG: hypothetical protein ACE5MH_06340, partial [Terriglobia bacterium]
EQPTETPSYSLSLPRSFARETNLSPASLLIFHLAEADEKPPKPEEEETNEKKEDKEKETEEQETEEEKQPLDFTVELVTQKGSLARLPVSHFRPLPPPLKVRFTKSSAMEKKWYRSPSEPVFQTYELPLAAFLEADSGFHPAELATIRFRFDRSPKGVIILDRVGFARQR